MRQVAYIFIAMFIFCALPAQAQGVAVADADYLMNETAAAKSVKAQLKTQSAKFQKEFKDTEATLQQEEKALIAKRPNLTEAEFKKQIEAFRAKMNEESKKFQTKKAKLDKAFQNALKELQKQIGLTIQEVAKEKGLAYVLSKQDVLFAAAGQPDITQDVLARLNQKTKTIDISIQ